VSDISKLIDEVLKLGLSPLMKAQGFRKAGRDFHRRVGENWHILNVQASQGNVGVAGKFTINLGVYLPAISNLVSAHAPAATPKEYECTVRARIGSVMPAKGDFWWQIDPSTDLGTVAKEVAKAVSGHAFAWFNAHNDAKQVAEALRFQPSIESAAAALVAGDRKGAIERIASMIGTRPSATKRAVAWAKEQGLEEGLNHLP
jgi:hypothetical protein